MSGYERPTERGTSPTKVSFWATISHDIEGKLVPYSKVSPAFGAQPELTAWIRSNREDGDEIVAWKRTIRGNDFTDERLVSRDDTKPDPARLRAILEDLSTMLDAKKRDLDRGKRVARD